MEEKTLVTGKVDTKKFLIISLIVVAVIFAISMAVFYGVADSVYSDWDYGTGRYFSRYYLPWICVGTAVLAGLCVVISLLMKKSEMEITDKRICVKGILGKRFVLPNDAITAVGYVPIIKGVLVSSPSGKAGMALMENAKELYETLTEQMLKRQK